MLIFERGAPGRNAAAQKPFGTNDTMDIDSSLLRSQPAGLPTVSELEVVRHFTNLSRKNFSIDTHFYPLGSCTMKYNREVLTGSVTAGVLESPPIGPGRVQSGLFVLCIWPPGNSERSHRYGGVSLAPMAGAQGEFAGVAMIKAYHDQRG